MNRLVAVVMLIGVCINPIEARKAKSAEAPAGPTLAPKGTTIIGSLSVPAHRTIPAFNIFVDGTCIRTTSDGIFRFKNQRPLNDAIYMLVGQYSMPKISRHSTVHRIAIEPSSKHRFFKLMPNPSNPKEWKVKEEGLKQHQYELPQETIIIAMNPDALRATRPFEVAVYQTDKNQLMLPRLVLKEGMTSKELHRLSAKSLLYPIDTFRFHPPVQTTTKEQKGRFGLVEVSTLEEVS